MNWLKKILFKKEYLYIDKQHTRIEFLERKIQKQQMYINNAIKELEALR